MLFFPDELVILCHFFFFFFNELQLEDRITLDHAHEQNAAGFWGEFLFFRTLG